MTEQQLNLSVPSIEDFIDGQRDAKRGAPADPDRSEDYQRGYGFEYQLEACTEARYAS